MPLSAHEYLRHIQDEARYLGEAIAPIDKATFLGDPTLQRAFVRSLEIIGEAVKQLPDTLRQQQPHIEWRAIARMRDLLIHAYFGVDYEIVWDAVSSKVPELAQAVTVLLAALENPASSS